jgi:hypothetical protein
MDQNVDLLERKELQGDILAESSEELTKIIEEELARTKSFVQHFERLEFLF